MSDLRASSWIRCVGLVGIVVMLPYQAAPPTPGWTGWLEANLVVFFGVLPVVAFLWLVASGFFGYGSPRREDWPALAMFLVALGVREGYARHGLSDNVIFFFHGVFRHRHSVVHPLFQAFVQSLARRPYLWMTHANGVLGAVATLPLYLFVRQRTQSGIAAMLVAAFFAVHPIIVQMAPTGGSYSLLLLTWFSGLAVLTAVEVGARQLFGGAVLLGTAATCRAEGSLYLVASLLLIDLRGLLRAVRIHPGVAALAACAVLGLLAVHVYFCFPIHVPPGEWLPSIGSFTFWDVLEAGLLSLDYNDAVFVALVAAGALGGLASKRFRIGLGAAVGTLIVIWPVSMVTGPGFLVLHRLVPACALQTIAAGVGAAWATTRVLGSPPRLHWTAALPALGIVLHLFTQHLEEIHAPNALTEEFWLLRRHLAPGGNVKAGCSLLSVRAPMDTDIASFSSVLPGIQSVHCEEEDCVRIVSEGEGGCFYYVRSLNCFSWQVELPPQCLRRNKASGRYVSECMDPRCAELERALELSEVEERSVDLHAVFPVPVDRLKGPSIVDIGLYRVTGVKR